MLAINLLENSRNQSNLKGEAFLDMALNETPLDQVDFTGNFEDAPINVEQLPQNQNILGNHQYLNNIGKFIYKLSTRFLLHEIINYNIS